MHSRGGRRRQGVSIHNRRSGFYRSIVAVSSTKEAMDCSLSFSIPALLLYGYNFDGGRELFPCQIVHGAKARVT